MVLQWLDQPSSTRGAHFYTNGRWDALTYDELASRVRRFASGLSATGVQHSNVVAIVLGQSADFITALYGVLLAGATPCVIAPPTAFQAEQHRERIARVLRVIAPALVLQEATERRLDGRATTVAEVVACGAGTVEKAPLAELALLQLTSGSAGDTRGVRVPRSALHANVAAIRAWLDWTEHDTSAFWVPPHHDMGLIGGVFAPISSQCDLWLMHHEQFIRRPLEYLRCFAEQGATLSALPPFGLDYITRRVHADQIRSWDFSGVKALVIGAELIDSTTLQRFAALLEPRGLRPTALLPAYGLAEATLAVTGVPLGTRWQTHVNSIVGCGTGLGDTTIAIVDEHGRSARDGEIGEIVVRGSGVATAYEGDAPLEPPTRFTPEGLFTGDAGFLVDKQLFPIGRFGDSIKIRGQRLHAELLERQLAQLGLRPEHNVILLGVRDRRPTVAWLTDSACDAEAGLAMLARSTEGAEVALVRVPRGSIARTTSGKPRRRILWNDFVAGLFSSTVKRG